MPKKLQNIKNIIFDLGEVIIDLDFERTQKAFRKLLGIDAVELYNLKTQTEIFDLLEVGKITPAEFRYQLNKLSKFEVSDEQLDAAWNSMLIKIPSKKIQLVQSLRLSYKTFILSNTNKIHIDYVNAILLPKQKLQSLDEIFDFVYYSHEIGARKPNANAYEFILNKHGINPKETLFIDDRIENIEAAEKLGIQTWHLKNREDLYEIS